MASSVTKTLDDAASVVLKCVDGAMPGMSTNTDNREMPSEPAKVSHGAAPGVPANAFDGGMPGASAKYTDDKTPTESTKSLGDAAPRMSAKESDGAVSDVPASTVDRPRQGCQLKLLTGDALVVSKDFQWCGTGDGAWSSFC